MKHLYLLFAIILIGSISYSQTDNSPKAYTGGGMGYFIVGAGQINFDGINQYLWSNLYPEVDNNFISLGGGGHFQYNRFIFGGEGQGFLSSNNSNEVYTTVGSGGYGFFNFGYVVYQKKRLSLYPLIGIGGGGYTIDVAKNLDDASFSAVMAGDASQIHMSRSSMLMNISIGTDYFFLANVSEDGVGGFSIGLRIGYTLDLASSWSTEAQNITKIPSTYFGGPFVKLVIGGGGFGK